MALDHKNYNPDLMQGASETIADDLTVTDTLTVGGATTLSSTLEVTSTSTLTGVVTAGTTVSVRQLVVPALAGSGVGAIAIDLSAVLGSQSAISAIASLDTVAAQTGTLAHAKGFMKINVAGTARYIPFFV